MLNPQKKRMIMPDIMLDTKNVMIPITRPVPVERSFNVAFPESLSRPQILRPQNHRNNPALLFFETPSHTLYDPLRRLVEVNRLGGARSKNQSTKYTISGRAEHHSASMRKVGMPENLCPGSQESSSSCRKNDHAFCFPNTVPVHTLEMARNRDLHKTSSRSIKLSRKGNLTEMRHDRERQERLAIIEAHLPKIEAQMSDEMISVSPAVSLVSQSFYDTTDTDSTISASSNCRIENKEAFANTQDRERSVSKIVSNQLQSINSECEINVLHYENDVAFPTENCFAHYAQRDQRSAKTDSCSDNRNSARIQDNDNTTDTKNRQMANIYKWNKTNEMPDVKYSWQVDDWMPFSQRKDHNDEIKSVNAYRGKPYECKVKYSWQVIGTGTQTSRSLLQDLLDTMANVDESAHKVCSIKYSWQIIGIGTQVALNDDCHDEGSDYWKGVLLSPNKNKGEDNFETDNNKKDHAELLARRRRAVAGLRRCLILNNQETQTLAEKEVQTDANAKYSWHNLIKQYV